MIEAWRPAPGFPDYEVSSLGRCRRGLHCISTGPNSYPGKILKPNVVRGYSHVGMYLDGVLHKPRVNRLICGAFHGDAPTPAHHAAHRDGERSNNASANLRWATPKENGEDKVRHGRSSLGERANTAKLTDDAVRRIRALKPYGPMTTRLAEEYGVTASMIRQVARGNFWKHVA